MAANGDKPPLAGEEFLLHRVTRGGRSLWYQLRIVQQPDRARACGPSTKGETDRRPVDPPPVIALRIYEGPSVHEGTDITFHYKSNFYMFANLEHARPAGARGNGADAPAGEGRKPAILGGVPAAGMVYLQRPERAGYFVFSDLCVRYEGRFRLTFTFFESIRDERDADAGGPPGTGAPSPADIKLRLEFQSRPFNVYTAKKFPGLNQSTELSLVMAQQGCRIRIRRDIRSRRQVQSPDDDQLMAESPPSAAAQPPLALVAQLPQAVAQPLGAQRSPPLRSRLMAASTTVRATAATATAAREAGGKMETNVQRYAAAQGTPVTYRVPHSPAPPPPLPPSRAGGPPPPRSLPAYALPSSIPAGDVPYIKVGELPPAAGYPAQAPPAPSHVRLPQPGPPAAVNPPPRTLTRVQNSDSDSRLRVDNLVSPASAPRLRIDYLVSPKSPSPPTASHQPYSAPDQCQSGPELAPMEDAARQGSSKRRLTGLASSGMDPGEPQTRPAHVHRHPG